MTENKKLNFVKGTAKVVVGASVTFVVAKAIKTYIPAENDIQKVKIYVGAYALSSLVTDKAVDYVDERFNRGIERIIELKNQIEEASQ